MNSAAYRILSSFIRKIIIRSEIRGDLDCFNRDNLVCVANHHESFGPMALFSTFSQKLYPWVTHEILDPETCASYLRADFVEPELKLSYPLSGIVSVLLAEICVSLMQHLQAIPVYKKSKRIVRALESQISAMYFACGEKISPWSVGQAVV